jgi:acid stress-induced BolA-like protein IbaG/YrbA
MSDHPTDFQGDILAAIRQAIGAKLPGAEVEVSGGGGHYSIGVTSAAFSGKSMLENQRLVYGAITHLMSGNQPPIHAVDKLTTRTP